MKTTFLVLHTAVMCFQRGSTVDDVPQTFQLLPATAWCPSGMYLQPNHPLWHFQNKAITHHLPPSATKTRGHAVQASCWICMCDPFLKNYSFFFCWKNISTYFSSMTNKPFLLCSEMSISQLVPWSNWQQCRKEIQLPNTSRCNE